MNVNELRRLIEEGRISPEQLSGMTLNIRDSAPAYSQPQTPEQLPTFDQFAEQGPAQGEGYMTSSDGRRITFGKKVSDAPMSSPPQQRKQLVSVFGANGRNLGQSDEQADIDFSRNKVSIPGFGSGYYSKDGTSAYVPTDSGYKKVLLGFDENAYQRNIDTDLKRQAQQANIAATQEQIASSQAQRTQRADSGADWTVDAERGLRINRRTGQAEPILMQGQPLGNKEKRLPSAEGEKLIMLDDLASKAEILTGMKEGDTGPIIGRVGEFLQSTFDPGGIDKRGMAANMNTTLLNARSGAAVTESEYNRLAPLLPTVTDNDDVFMRKAENFRNEMKRIRALRADFYKEQGFKVPESKARTAEAPPKAGDVVDGYRFKGGNAGSPSNWEKL